MSGYDPNQPRDEIGRWTDDARSAAGLPPKERNTTEQILKAHLDGVDKISAGNSAESYVLKHGKFYNPKPLPKGIKFGEKRGCFSNAAHLVWENPKYTYVEGFAFPDFIDLPIHHAWVVDSAGNVIDNTWCELGRAYFGVPVALTDLSFVLSESETYGFIDFSKKSFRDIMKRDN